MKFITVRDLRTSPAKIWKTLPDEQEMIITNNGKPIALLTPLSDSNLEVTLSSVRQARATAAVRNMQQTSTRAGNNTMTQDAIQAEIKSVRTSRN